VAARKVGGLRLSYYPLGYPMLYAAALCRRKELSKYWEDASGTFCVNQIQEEMKVETQKGELVRHFDTKLVKMGL
jgi:hypothetical protein